MRTSTSGISLVQEIPIIVAFALLLSQRKFLIAVTRNAKFQLYNWKFNFLIGNWELKVAIYLVEHGVWFPFASLKNVRR